MDNREIVGLRWARRQVLITTSKRAPCLQIGSFPSWKCHFYLSCVFQSFCGCQSKWCREISPPHLIRISCCGAVAIPPTLYLWSSILRSPGSSKGWQPVLGSIGPLCSTNTALIKKKKKEKRIFRKYWIRLSYNLKNYADRGGPVIGRGGKHPP